MLDDLKKIHERDAQDMLGAAERQILQLASPVVVPEFPSNAIQNIVYVGTGNSVLSAMHISAIATMSKPFEIVRTYDIPSYVDHTTLCIASSISGDTEETVAAVRRTIARRARIVMIAGGGELATIAQTNGYPLIMLPTMQHPRFISLYGIKVIWSILEQAGVTTVDGQAITEAQQFLRTAVQSWLPTTPTKRNLAKLIAQECIGKSIVIYSGPKLHPAAYSWKVGFNEYAKQLAWTGQYPEFGHAELMGWTKQPEHKPYTVIELRSDLEHPSIQKQSNVAERLLSGLRPGPLVVSVQGNTILQQVLWANVLGNFVSLYMSILSNAQPASRQLINTFKNQMKE